MAKSPNPNMRRIVLDMPEADFQAVRNISAERDLSMNQLLRRFIKAQLSAEELSLSSEQKQESSTHRDQL